MSTLYPSTMRNQSGQVILIVVLIMVVALTVGLSLVSRTLVNVKTSTDTASSQKAFSAAEAGIEQALQQGVNLKSGSFTPNQLSDPLTNISTSVTDVGGPNNQIKQLSLNNNDIIHQDEGIDVYLANLDFTNPYSAGNTITVYWGTSGNCATSPDAALEIITITGSASLGKVTTAQTLHDAFDPCSGSRSNADNFMTPTTDSSFAPYKYSTKITIPAASNGLLLHLVPLYSDTKIGIIGSANLPLQGQIIKSTGTSGQTNRQISLYQSNGQIPSELFYTLFVPK